MAILYVEKGNEKGQFLKIETGRTLTVGRDARCQFQIDDGLASRQHFQVKEHNGSVYVRDLGSQNGTQLNDRSIEKPTPITDGDKIQAGETIFTFQNRDAPEGKDERIIGGYRLVERLGRGGMGVVYKAVQLSLDREVALKILSPKLSADQTFVKLFFEEARAAGALNHPNIVAVYDVASEGDLNFISMELMEEGSVEDLLRREKVLDAETAVSVMIDAARGLQYAEGKRIVHRDIKPDNLMINEDGHVKIADLGLAKSTLDGGAGGEEGILGTPHFIAPEQAQGKPVDTRADMYSLGAASYRIVTGSTPFQGSTAKEIVLKQIQEEPRPVREVNPEVPDDLAEIIERLMEKDPEDRYATAAELIEDLEQVQKAHKYGRGGGAVAKVAVVVAVLLTAALIWALTRGNGNGEGPITVITPAEDTERTLEQQKRLIESEARSAFLEIQLRQSEASRDEMATDYDALAEKYPETEAGREAAGLADSIRTAIAEEARLAAEAERAEQARVAALASKFESLEAAVRSSIEKKRYITGLAAALRANDVEPLRADEEYAPKVDALLQEHYDAASSFATAEAENEFDADSPESIDDAIESVDTALESFGAATQGAPSPDPAAEALDRYADLRTRLADRRADLVDARTDAGLRNDRDAFFAPVAEAYRTLVPNARFDEALRRLDAIESDIESAEYRRRLDRLREPLRRAAATHEQLVESVNGGDLAKIAVPIVAGQRGQERGFPKRADSDGITFEIQLRNGSLDETRSWSELSANEYVFLLENGLRLEGEALLDTVRLFIAQGRLAAAVDLFKRIAPTTVLATPNPYAPKPAAANGSGGASSETPAPPQLDEADRPFAEVLAELYREIEGDRLRKVAEARAADDQWQQSLRALDRLTGVFGDTRAAIVNSDGTSHYYRKELRARDE